MSTNHKVYQKEISTIRKKTFMVEMAINLYKTEQDTDSTRQTSAKSNQLKKRLNCVCLVLRHTKTAQDTQHRQQI